MVDRSENGRRITVRVVFRSPSSRIDPKMITTNAAALAVAEQHGLPAPRLLGVDFDGLDAGTPVSVESVVPGTSAWPVECVPDLLEPREPRSPEFTRSSSNHGQHFRPGPDRSRSMTSLVSGGSDGCRLPTCSAAPMNESSR